MSCQINRNYGSLSVVKGSPTGGNVDNIFSPYFCEWNSNQLHPKDVNVQQIDYLPNYIHKTIKHQILTFKTKFLGYKIIRQTAKRQRRAPIQPTKKSQC